MEICWYCHWGWSKPVMDIYKKYAKMLDDPEQVLHFGPGHIVWDDENFDTNSIKFCLESLTDPKNIPDKNEWSSYNTMTGRDLIIALCSLKELLLIPENIRDPEPEKYQELNHTSANPDPIDYPPANGIEMVKK